ncbi:MAG: CotH kinase family protein, partial [Bacteroidota bacterium]
NGGFPEFQSTMMRDGLGQSLLTGKMDIDGQSYRPCVVYLNGEYWGLYNIREKQNEDYLASNHNIDPDNVNILENSGVSIVEGSDADYTILNNFIENNDINNSTNYEFVKNEVDIDEYIDYLISEIYLCNTDWPMINIKYWKPNTENGKWRWILFDLDAGLGMWGVVYYNSIQHATETDAPGWPNPPESTLFFRNMLVSTEFKNEFIQRFAAHSNITFSSQRIIHFVDSLQSNIESEMPYHIARWKDYNSNDGVCVQSVAEWENEVEVIRNFANNRQDYIFQYIIDNFSLSGTIDFTTNASNGHIEINTVEIPKGSQTGTYFKNVPLKLKAVHDLGYQFVGWTGCSSATSSSISINLFDNNSITALFSPTNQTIIPAQIDTNTTLLLSESPYISLGDIVVDSNKTLSIEPGVEILMPDSACFIVYGELIIDGTNSNPVTIDANTDINATKWGAICFYNATDTGRISNLIINNASIGRNKDLQIGAISAYNSNVIIDNTYIDNVIQPFYSQYGSIMIKNSEFRSERTCDLINIKYANSAIVENCNLRGNESPDTDAIDYDQINNGIIRNNKIYGFFGFNSDGIDIGEAASNVLIENNIIFNCSDKGISVGQASSAIVKRNLIYNCNMGVGVKDSLSFTDINQNTFYNNNYAVACFEKNYNDGGGNAIVTNSILSSCNVNPLFIDEFSSIITSYSLSDTEELQGTGNYLDNPLFTDTLIMNFELLPISPCIDAGDPSSPPDPDLSNADIGAYYTYSGNSDTLIVINEINYHSSLIEDSDDWIEFYNNSDEDKDMSGWILMDSKNDNIYNFPEGFKLNARELIVVCSDIIKFNSIHTSVTNFRGNLGFGLNNDGEFIRLFDAEMNFADIVEYDNVSPWPIEPDGLGPTLELIDPDFNNILASSWRPSANIGGSPGLQNNVDIIEVYTHSNKFLIYPNPANDFINIEIENATNELSFVNMNIYNIYGQLIFEEKYENVQNQFFQKVNVSNFSNGVYIIMISTNLSQNKIKIVKGY